jgi:hypothetical protein
MRNVTAQPNIVITSVVGCGTAAACRGNVNKGAMVPLEHVSPEARPRNCFGTKPVHSIYMSILKPIYMSILKRRV